MDDGDEFLTLDGLIPSWHREAACNGLPTEWFYRPRGDRADRAKATCAVCPVLVECLEGAIDRDETYGIWGGAGEAQRRLMRRVRSTRAHDDPAAQVGCRCRWCVELRRHVNQLRGGIAVGVAREARRPVPVRIGPGARHGLRSSYVKGCRCWPCRWSASSLGQAMAAVGVDTAAMWTEYAASGPGYLEARELVDDAAWVVVESLVVAFLSVSPGAGVWSRAEVRAMIERRRTERRRLAPQQTGETPAPERAAA